MRSVKASSCASSSDSFFCSPWALVTTKSRNNCIFTFCGRSPTASAISVCSFAANELYDSLAITVSSFTSNTPPCSTLSSCRSPCWFTQRRIPRPTSWRFFVWLSESFNVQIWNTLGLSQPSFRAECEKMKRVGSLNDSRRSLSFIIRS